MGNGAAGETERVCDTGDVESGGCCVAGFVMMGVWQMQEKLYSR